MARIMARIWVASRAEIVLCRVWTLEESRSRGWPHSRRNSLAGQRNSGMSCRTGRKVKTSYWQNEFSFLYRDASLPTGGADNPPPPPQDSPSGSLLSQRKLAKRRSRRILDNWMTIQDLLAHGSHSPDGRKLFSPLLSVTTVWPPSDLHLTLIWPLSPQSGLQTGSGMSVRPLNQMFRDLICDLSCGSSSPSLSSHIQSKEDVGPVEWPQSDHRLSEDMSSLH